MERKVLQGKDIEFWENFVKSFGAYHAAEAMGMEEPQIRNELVLEHGQWHIRVWHSEYEEIFEICPVTSVSEMCDFILDSRIRIARVAAMRRAEFAVEPGQERTPPKDEEE